MAPERGKIEGGMWLEVRSLRFEVAGGRPKVRQSDVLCRYMSV